MSRSKLLTEVAKCASKYEKRVTILKRIILRQEEVMEKRKKMLYQHKTFVGDMLEQGRITKEELSKYFKKIKNELKNT